MLIHNDCRHFRGDIPCTPHKLHGVHCEGCTFYDPAPQKVLIIKLGAIGDVIRTTPILSKLKAQYPKALIYWVTYSPDVLPDAVDIKLTLNLPALLQLEETDFDLAINLDKDREACALLNRVKATEKKGFSLKAGKCEPISASGKHKFETGVLDDVSKANTKSYVEEIFEICDLKYEKDDYVLENPFAGKKNWELDKTKKVIGLNTGCGGRWVTRLWEEKNWTELAIALIAQGFEVVLLGGEQEDAVNKRIAAGSSAKYFGHFPMKIFIDEIAQCDVVITQVTMAMHLAIGMKCKLILMNNIFNRHEFELYGRGEIIEPPTGCDCFYAPSCTRESNGGIHCMKDITPEMVLSAVKRTLSSESR
ncbi:MAG: glycosyltransferase family 9 protein [Chloroherpetonaceae bacterium]|nr:glycosyltransferase family 9 protein [Chloroherpetonaceae bacterium]